MERKKFLSATQYPRVLLQSLNKQRGCGLFCDVTVIVEGQQFRAHRNILSASSTYFHQLFSVAGQVVELSFVRAEIFGKILDYIYSSKITSARSDVLDEVIKSGQELGVKFIGDLGTPPAKGKNVPSKVKDSASGTSASSPHQRDAETQETVIRPEGQEAADGMPVMTHSFSLQGVQFEATKITVSDWDGEDDDDDDDVIFCSEIAPPKECAKDKKAASQTQACSSPAGASDQKSRGSGGSPHLTNTAAAQNLTLSASQLNSNQTQSGAESPVSATPQHFTGDIIGLNRPLLDSSLAASSLHQTRVTPAINLLEENHQPSHNGSITGVEATAVDDEQVVEDDVISSSSPGSVSSSSLVQQPSVSKAASTEGSGVQKKQFTFSQEASPQPGELKIKISDVLSGNNKELGSGVASKDVADGLRIRTFDTASAIRGLSTGCKVYANISEDTYDIIIPVENDSEEGEAEPDHTPKRSGDESRKRKRMKVKHNNHYELVEDGRVYYICIVCHRPFLHLSSLWRHFNIHSWEKKFLCRYCDKVFALAECRTRHELLHTRERRYQCLLCGEFLLRYQNVASHIRSVHGQEPSGDTKLYQLHPCRSLRVRQDTCISDHPPSSVPGINEGGIVCCGGSGKDGTEGATSNSPAKQITWDDIFVPQGNETICKQNQLEGITELEFVRPESH